MASATYQARVLVLKRTKLGETDCICTLLAEDGSQIRAVAKGARKPTSAFTSRLELFSVCDVLLARGKTLDIIKEARLIEGYPRLRQHLELAEAASPLVELLEKATVDNLENTHLFPLTTKALSYLNSETLSQETILTLTCAHLLKAVSFLGFKPQCRYCIGCGREVFDNQAPSQQFLSFSYLEGGVTCSNCSAEFETQKIESSILQWGETLLYSTFEEIVTFTLTPYLQQGLLRFLQSWIKIHVGYSLKSLTYIFSYGLQTSSCEDTEKALY